MTRFLLCLSLLCLYLTAGFLCVCLAGCGNTPDGSEGPDPAVESGVARRIPSSEPVKTLDGVPVFYNKISEYPSWTVFLVAAKYGWINPAKGWQGELETKWGVDVVIDAVDYDKCLELYGLGACDSVCITNMDVLPIAKTVPSTVILPTSTSAGGDQCIVVGISDLNELKNFPIHLLTKSVSDYTVFSVLEKNGLNYRDYQIEHLDPAAAATALQNNSTQVRAICVWNPFALTTTNKNPNATVLFSSDQIAGEIVDTVTISNASLKRPGGEDYAKCICEIYYKVSEVISYDQDWQLVLTGPQQDNTLKLLAEDFAPDLTAEDMRKVVTQTRFYSTPQAGLDLFKSEEFRKVNEKVVRICQALETLDKNPPTIGYNDPSAALNFDSRFINAVK